MDDYLFFICKSIPEYQIITFFKEQYQLELDSPDCPNEAAKAFLYYSEEDGDIKFYIHVMLPNGMDLKEEPVEVAKNLAMFYRTDVLVELENPYENREYLLFNDLGNMYAADIEAEDEKFLINRIIEAPDILNKMEQKVSGKVS